MEFYAHDGVRLASTTNAQTLGFLPYFKMNIDNQSDIIVIGEKSFSFKNDEFNLDADSKIMYDFCKEYDMKDSTAL